MLTYISSKRTQLQMAAVAGLLAVFAITTSTRSVESKPKPKYTWEKTERTCKKEGELGIPPKVVIGWETKETCTKTDGRLNEPYDLVVGVMAASDWGAPDRVIVTDLDGNPLTMEGVSVSFVEDQAAADEADMHYGTPTDFAWTGYITSVQIPSSEGDGSIEYYITYEWDFIGEDDPADVIDQGGATWSSDNNNELYGHHVTMAYDEIPAE